MPYDAQYFRDYYRNNRERILARTHDYYRRNRTRIHAQKKEYSIRNIDKITAARKARYLANREANIAATQSWYRKNIEARREYSKAYYIKNRELTLARLKTKRLDASRRRAEARIASLGFNLFGGQQNMAEKEKVYINSPFKSSTAKRIKALAEKSSRSLGRQVAWMVERFMEER